jgi:glycosyltransferase involved in cell wall biosynthesis
MHEDPVIAHTVRKCCSALPLVSVVIPAHNASRHLRECIDSVLAQDYAPLQVIVVDDGSTDDTPRIMAEYKDRITAVTQMNGGAAAARNNGMAHAAGKYIAFLDSDDVWLPGKLRAQVAVLEEDPSIGLVCARWRRWYPDQNGIYPPPERVDGTDERAPAPARSGWLYTDLLQHCVIWTSTVVIRRDITETVGAFDPALRRGQDYDYWLRAARLTRIRELDRELALYRMDDASVARKAGGVNWEVQVVSRAVDRWGTKGPDGRSLPASDLRRRFWQLHFDFGYQQFHQRNFVIARRAFASALRFRPFHAKTCAYAVASMIRRLTS